MLPEVAVLHPFIRLAALVAAVVLLGACGGPRGDVAATVDDREISVATLETYVTGQIAGESPLGRPSPDSYADVDRLQRDILGQLIQDEIVAQAADELGVEVTDEEIAEQWEALASQFGGEEELVAEIERRGLTEDDVRRQLAAFVRREKLSDHFAQAAEVSEEDLRAAYEERLEAQYTVARASHILVEAEDQARDLLAQLEEGADFAELAREHSQDEFSAVRGGDLGENPRGTFVQEFDDALWEAEEGEIVGPVQTQFGWHIIKVDELRETPIEEVEATLLEELRGLAAGEGFDVWIAGAFADADVQVNSRFGRWDPATGAVVPRSTIERGPSAPQPAEGDGAGDEPVVVPEG